MREIDTSAEAEPKTATETLAHHDFLEDIRAVQARHAALLVERDRLAAENARLTKAMREIEADCEADYPPSHGAIKYAIRAALAPEPGHD